MSLVVRELSQSPGVGDLRDETSEPTSERGGEDARVLTGAARRRPCVRERRFRSCKR
jgi:hypothetical protein